MRELAAAHGLDALRVIDAAAVLSPATGWDPLVARLPRFLRAARLGAPRPRMPGYGPNVRKAWAMLREETVYVHAWGRIREAQPSGPKVTRFARNLAGDRSCVTVDRWAARAAGLPQPNTLRRYLAIERAYQVAARELRMAPADVQAIVWVAVRDGTIPWGTPVRSVPGPG